MRFDYHECREVLFRSLMSGLLNHADLIRELEAEHRDRSCLGNGLRAISYDVLPWQPFVAVSFCTASDDWPRVRWEPTDDQWTGCNLIGLHNALESLEPALKYVHEAHLGNPDSRELYHLIFLATADALLDPQVAELLQQCNIPTKAVKDQFPDSSFDYVVVDEDRVFMGNYCEMLTAHRVARRLLGTPVV